MFLHHTCIKVISTTFLVQIVTNFCYYMVVILVYLQLFYHQACQLWGTSARQFLSVFGNFWADAVAW